MLSKNKMMKKFNNDGKEMKLITRSKSGEFSENVDILHDDHRPITPPNYFRAPTPDNFYNLNTTVTLHGEYHEVYPINNLPSFKNETLNVDQNSPRPVEGLLTQKTSSSKPKIVGFTPKKNESLEKKTKPIDDLDELIIYLGETSKDLQSSVENQLSNRP